MGVGVVRPLGDPSSAMVLKHPPRETPPMRDGMAISVTILGVRDGAVVSGM